MMDWRLPFEPPDCSIDNRFHFPSIWKTDVQCSWTGRCKFCACQSVPGYIHAHHFFFHNHAVASWYCNPFWHTVSYLDLLQRPGLQSQESIDNLCLTLDESLTPLWKNHFDVPISFSSCIYFESLYITKSTTPFSSKNKCDASIYVYTLDAASTCRCFWTHCFWNPRTFGEKLVKKKELRWFSLVVSGLLSIFRMSYHSALRGRYRKD